MSPTSTFTPVFLEAGVLKLTGAAYSGWGNSRHMIVSCACIVHAVGHLRLRISFLLCRSGIDIAAMCAAGQFRLNSVIAAAVEPFNAVRLDLPPEHQLLGRRCDP
ncbi:hypothetical protein EXIGLDRAFT_11723 [Exidia glandulosa HHB12029]|uniref:Uncharacterized protein n=1 Tax=Exidia glandulosa HHB12029 TaxID=1314781 RepID=A0A166BU07_EXIGL|nr:hypothetical protein EXIGLDRAFT_11723 [Exidia glandulosa HHB12029]